jgi:hypothetical protein
MRSFARSSTTHLEIDRRTMCWERAPAEAEGVDLSLVRPGQPLNLLALPAEDCGGVATRAPRPKPDGHERQRI